MLNQKPIQTKFGTLQPTVEALYIPLTAVLAAFGLAASILRLLTLISGMTGGRLPYFAIGLAALSSVITTTTIRVLNLPKLLHATAFLITSGVNMLLLAFAPATSGQLYLGGQWVRLALFPWAVIITILAWFTAAALSWIVVWVYPTRQKEPEDEAIAQRLMTETELRRIYSGGLYNQFAGEKSSRVAYKTLFGLLLAFLIVNLIWPNIEQVRADAALAVLNGITVAAVLAYLALTDLSGMRRRMEKNAVQQVLPGYHKAWLYGVMLPAAVAGGLGCLLPANISPLAYLDYNAIMDRVTVFIVGFFFRSGSSVNQYHSSVTLGAPGAGGAGGPLGGAGGTSGPIPIIVVLLIPALAYVVYRSVRNLTPSAEMVLSNENERSRGLLRILKALFAWPWRWLRRRFGADRRHGDADTAAEATIMAQLRRGMHRRRRRRYPDDQALFIRHIYARMLQMAAEAGYQRRRQQTAHEYAVALTQQVPDAAEALADLTQTYCDVRYTQKVPAGTSRSGVLNLLRRISGQFRRSKRRNT
ncbi:MAG TPA: DUF4129 domain-containing protein [Firmicutes bacterium]|nr:DUF4129 domain-containing protein [Bacillota bacterium]